jgi:hypothetical protein
MLMVKGECCKGLRKGRTLHLPSTIYHPPWALNHALFFRAVFAMFAVYPFYGLTK